ncbi:MAG: phage tail tape measure protein [Pseudomonadota bacterium]
MTDSDMLGDLDDLTEAFSSVQSFSSAFREELQKVQAELRGTDKESKSLSRSMGSTLRGAFEDLVLDGGRATNVLRQLGAGLASDVFASAIKPVQSALGVGVNSVVSGGLSSLFGGILPFAKGGVVSSGRMQAFASGGVVSGPTAFPMRNGTGLMGEAGPEAIMPLARGPDGRLGVRGGGGVQVTMNITTPDVDGFRRSRSQIAADVSRALRQGQRNL